MMRVSRKGLCKQFKKVSERMVQSTCCWRKEAISKRPGIIFQTTAQQAASPIINVSQHEKAMFLPYNGRKSKAKQSSARGEQIEAHTRSNTHE
jgi:hypothetical protein